MLHVLNHPLITHKLSVMRQKDTCNREFRRNLDEIASLMVYDVTKDLPTKPVVVETPMGKCETTNLAKDVVIVPILRAGLGLLSGFQAMMPDAKVGHIGLYRNEETLQPVEYFGKYPKNLAEATVIVVDPMLATGGSADAAIQMLKSHGATDIRLVCLVGVMEGVRVVEKNHPEVDIYLAALDEKLNEIGYIVPGLGDAGDRIFGTD